MNNNCAISVNGIKKKYKLYEKKLDRLKDALGLSFLSHFKEHWALKGVSFNVEKGECIGIIGTNGAGKSTILKIITGVVSPTEGNVEIDGRISALLELGAGFNLEYTGIENIYLNGTMMGFTKDEVDKKLDDILKFADIGEFVYQPVKTYSSGMFVRLAFAVAINIEPEILIVDEALSVGDVFFQAKCYQKFEEFKKQGKTILFVSHDLSSIEKYCDRAILLNKGEMVSDGTPKDIIDLYKQILAGQSSGGNLKKELDGSQDYGDKKAEIIDYKVIDSSGRETTSLLKGEEFSIEVTIRANEPVVSPIVAITIRNSKGTDITGTNTMYEKVDLGHLEPGDERTVVFTQNMDLQGGDYLLSLGCTRFEEYELRVFHRLYDVTELTVISSKDTVGFFDLNSKVSVRE
ncbi:MAG: ABC transporter ATP-binding protein [Eubacterium sp.]|nr:ABC transporter ATP-binding protein [Eubacterium sp.]